MASTKLPNLTALTTVADDDELYINDVSDTTDGASGTNKKITRADILDSLVITSATFVTPTLGVATVTSINKLTITQPAASATLTIADTGSLITSGAYAITLTATAATNVTLPTTGTLITLAGTETLTNKTIVADNNNITLTSDYDEITSDFTTTTVSSDVDVTGLASASISFNGTQKARVTVFCGTFSVTAAGLKTLLLRLKEGGTVLQDCQFIYNVANSGYTYSATLQWVGTPTNGTHAYKAAVWQDAAGTITLAAGANKPSFILVEKI